MTSRKVINTNYRMTLVLICLLRDVAFSGCSQITSLSEEGGERGPPSVTAHNFFSRKDLTLA